MVMTGRLLAKNALINMVGQASPFVVAVVAIPVALRGFGPERYLTWSWARARLAA